MKLLRRLLHQKTQLSDKSLELSAVDAKLDEMRAQQLRIELALKALTDRSNGDAIRDRRITWIHWAFSSQLAVQIVVLIWALFRDTWPNDSLDRLTFVLMIMPVFGLVLMTEFTIVGISHVRQNLISALRTFKRSDALQALLLAIAGPIFVVVVLSRDSVIDRGLATVVAGFMTIVLQAFFTRLGLRMLKLVRLRGDFDLETARLGVRLTFWGLSNITWALCFYYLISTRLE